MLISAHDASNINYTGPATGWQLGWTSQQLVTSIIVTATGGTYELKPNRHEPSVLYIEQMAQ